MTEATAPVALRSNWRLGLTKLAPLAMGPGTLSEMFWPLTVTEVAPSVPLPVLAVAVISGLGLDGSLPEIFQPRALCADAAVKLLGLPYEFWSLALFVLLGLMALRLLAATRR